MALLLGLALLAAACGAGAPTSSPNQSPPPGGSGGGMVDANGDWVLVRGTVDGAPIPIVGGADITLTIDGSHVGGRSACNQYGGEVIVKDGVVQFGQLMMTEMACAEPIMASEAAYHAALGRIRSATRDGDMLTLSGPGVELVVRRVVPPPPAALVDTDWILDSIITGDAVSSVMGDPASLRLAADGTLTGTTGCRGFTGRYAFAATTVSVSDFAVDQVACSPELAGQDAAVLRVLGERFAVAVDGQHMSATGPAGAGLGYTTREPEIPPAP